MKKITILFVLLFAFAEGRSQTVLTESFDTGLNWSVVNLSANTNAGWTQQTSGTFPTCAPFAGAGMARFNSFSVSAGDAYELNSPAITFAGGSYRFKFNMFRDTGYPADIDVVDVYYNTTPGSTGGILIGTVNRNNTVNAWNGYTFLIPGTPTGTGYISLKATSAYGNNIFVDEIVVENVPACAEPTALIASAVTSSGATVNWTAPGTPPANGYEYFYSTSSVLPNNATVPNGTAAAGVTNKVITGLNPATTYYVYIRSVCSGSSSSPWSNSTSFLTSCVSVATLNENFNTVTIPSLPACWSKILSGSTLSTSASVGTSTTNSSAPNGVALYNSSSTDTDNIMLVSPQLSNLSTGLNRLKFNARTSLLGQDLIIGTLTDPTDAATFTPLQTVVLGTVFAPYTVNFSSYSGSNTYIAFRRVSTATYNYIYLDDVVWEPIPSCVEPTAPLSSAITSSGATIYWTAPTAPPMNGYAYYLSTTPTAPINATVPTGSVGAGVTTTNLTTLAPATTYYFWIRSTCSISNSSAWSASGSFLTACVPVTTLPWIENFDTLTTLGTTNFPPCWYKENGDWSTSNATTYNTPRSGTNYLREAWLATNEYMWTPGFTLSAGTSYDFSYWTQSDGGTGWTADTFVSASQVSTATVPTQLGVAYSYPGSGTYVPGQYIQIKNSFTPTTTGTYYFAVRVNQPSLAPWYVAFDDFKVELSPSCTEPTALTASAVTTTGATISWTASPTAATGYDYYYSTTNTTPTNATMPTGSVLAGVTTQSITGLTGATSYYFWVRSKCSTTVTSAWSDSASFTTLCLSATVPYSVDFESATVGSVPTCTTVINEGTGNLWNVVNSPGSGFTNKCLQYSYNGTNPANVWFYTNGLSLTGGTSYTVTLRYGNNSSTYSENLKVAYGTARSSASMTNIIGDYPGITGGTPNTASVSITPASTGIYYLGFQAYSIADQFSLYVDDITIDTALSATSFNSNGFKFYPNPVTSILNLEYSKDITTVAVFNLLGQEVLVKSVNTNQSQIDMSNLSAGTYMVKVISEGVAKVIKVNKQ